MFGFYCDWSAQTIYDDWYITLFNVLFTAFAISYLGAMD
jgi:magnesium-transporting ATPase (P-type)